ncbi:MAG: hypothetical protein AVDCRST_MAG37-1653, partial [uncultured Rubrobacteraceae bacterium]
GDGTRGNARSLSVALQHQAKKRPLYSSGCRRSIAFRPRSPTPGL